MLYFLPVPIGNIDDITKRTVIAIQSLSHLICEDTRHTKKLLQLLNIDYNDKQFYSLTSFTSQHKLSFFVKLIKEQDVGMLSDAGTPGLSDPGKKIVEICNKNNLTYTVFPGANALVPAVVASAFDTSKFLYLGFLPTKKGRQTIMKSIIASDYPVFVYESVHRIAKTLTQLYDLGFRGKVSIAREISKMHEQLVNDQIEEVIAMIEKKEIVLKGEFVIGFGK